MSPRFLCTGDLHLGAGADLGREPGERLAEQEAVLERIVQLANDLDVPLVFAGDAWERRRPTPAELLAYFRPMAQSKRETLAICGNHDVEAFGRPTGYDLRGNLHQARPDVVCMDGVAFCCLPWAPPGHLVALEGGGDRDELNHRLAQGLVEIARGLQAKARELGDLPVVLLAHWSIGGAYTPTGAPVDLFREPVLPLEELDAIGFDAIVAGHIHKPQMLGERGFYVGSPMPLNFGEAASAHVVWLLDVEPGKFQAFQIPIESRPLVNLVRDATRDVELIGEEIYLAPFVAPDVVAGAIVKAKIRATEEQARRLDVAAVKREILEAGAHKVWAVQVEVDRPELARGAELAEDTTDAEALARWIELNSQEVRLDTDSASDLLEVGCGYLERAA